MGRRGFNDEAQNEWVEDGFDDHLRSEFAREFDDGAEPDQVFATLGPQFKRARRSHQAKQVLLSVAASIVLLGGVGFALNSIGDGANDSPTIAGQPETGTGEDAADDALQVTGTTVSDRQAEPPTASGATSESDAEQSTGSDRENQTATTVEQGGSTVTSTPTPATTTQATPTSSTFDETPSTTLIESECGSIGLGISGSTVTLMETFPASGYSVDEKSSGPHSIEVGFEGGGGHCELKAEMRDGGLYIDQD